MTEKAKTLTKAAIAHLLRAATGVTGRASFVMMTGRASFVMIKSFTEAV